MAHAWLLEHLDDPNPIDNTARACGLSRALLCAVQEDTGMTPTLLLNDARACAGFAWLERERSGTLGLLSENLGFSEQGLFTRFPQHIGASPSQYRRVVDCYAAV